MGDEVLSCELCGYWTYVDNTYRREFDVRCSECLEPGCPARGEGCSLIRVCFACCGDIHGDGQHHHDPCTVESNDKVREGAVEQIKKLADAKLLSRSDQDWERMTSNARIGRVRSWAADAVFAMGVAQALGGDVDKDDQFSAMVDRVYDGLRDSLTRQDLLVMVLTTIMEEQNFRVSRVLQTQGRQLRQLDDPKRRAALLRIEQSAEGQ